MIRLYYTIILSLILYTFFSSCKEESVIKLAEVDDITIDSEVFLEKIKEVRHRFGMPDNGLVRRNVLQKLINDKLFVLEAKRLGFADDSTGQFFRSKINIQTLIDLYTTRVVFNEVDLSENNIKDLYIKNETSIKARHLYASGKKEADSLYALLMSGISFNELAASVFNDPQLSETGGDLGYFNVSDMELGFSEAVSRMKVGEISKPVKTNFGYSIIKVEDRKGNPFKTETQYLGKRTKTLELLKTREMQRVAKQFVNDKVMELNISFNNEVVEDLFRFIGKSSTSPQEIQSTENAIYSIPQNLKKEILVNSDLGEWTVEMFIEKVKFTAEKQRTWIINKENFEEFINGLVVRDYILNDARKLKLDKTKEYLSKTNIEFENYLINRLSNNFKNDIQISKSDIEIFYSRNKDNFRTPSAVNLREIIVNDEKQSQKVASLLKAGKRFADLATKYSINKNTAVFGGETGYINTSALLGWQESILKLKPGEWLGPLKKDGALFFIELIDYKESVVMDLNTVYQKIEEKIRNEQFQNEIENKLAEIESRTNVVSYPQELRKVKYNFN